MPTIYIEPDGKDFPALPDESVLEAALRAGIHVAHACDGYARCSTCRIHVDHGAVSPRNTLEQNMAKRLVFDESLRLACQARAESDLRIRRLVLDDDDLALLDQRLRRHTAPATGRELELAIVFADLRGFTSFSERLPPHDVIHVLNRFTHAMGQCIQHHEGVINNFMGDGLLALFGLDDPGPQQALNAVRGTLEMLSAMDALQPYLRSAYGQDLDIRIGIHFGVAVLGSVEGGGRTQMTAIGDDVNFASRIEGACKAAEARLLVSETMHDRLGDRVQYGRSIVTAIRGRHGDHRLFEVLGLEGA